MPALALRPANDPAAASAATLCADLPVHLSPLAAAEIESLIGGRIGRITRHQLPRLRAMCGTRVGDTDLVEFIRAVDRDGAVDVRFL